MVLSIIYRLCMMMLDIKQTIKDRDHDLIADNDYTGLYLLLILIKGKDMYCYRHKHSYANRPKKGLYKRKKDKYHPFLKKKKERKERISYYEKRKTKKELLQEENNRLRKEERDYQDYRYNIIYSFEEHLIDRFHTYYSPYFSKYDYDTLSNYERKQLPSYIHIYCRYGKYMEDLTYQDIMKRYPTIDTNTAKRIILFTHDILGNDKGDNKIVKYDICRLTMTGRINEDGYHELTVKKIKEYLHHLSLIKRFDKEINSLIKGIYNNIQCSDDGIWHLHCVIVVKIKQNKWNDIEKEKSENRNKIKDYYYRVVGRVEGYHGRKIEECVKVGMNHVHISIDSPRYPDQRWYTTVVDDRNNLLDYIGYQCQENDLMKEYRQLNKHKQLSTTHVYKDILMD